MAYIFKRSYSTTDRLGKPVIRKCDHYTIQYRDAAGKLQRITPRDKNGQKITDKGVAEKYWNDLRGSWAKETVGLANQFQSQMARPLSEQINDYTDDLRTTGRDPMYIYTANKRLTTLADECGWKTLAGIDANSFMRWRNARQKTGNPKGYGNLTDKGAAATTLNQFLDTARAFMNWCAANDRVPGVAVGSRVISPILAGVAKADGAKIRKRRALSDDEVTKLMNVTPANRLLFNRTGLSLGLRRSELEQLQWGDVRLNAIRPYVLLRAEATKGRRSDRLDIPATLAADLRASKPGNAKDNDCVFPDAPDITAWKADLTAAKIDYKDEMGRQADFHAGTRKTLCSRLHRQGVSLAVAMRRMRHTDAKLTMVDYVDDEQIGIEAGVLDEILPTPATIAAVAM